MEEQQVLNITSICLYSCLSYLGCKLHLFCAELHCHLWPVWLYHIFPYYLINGMIFFFGGGGNTEHKMCFDFVYSFCLKHFSF
jgi:hypothetical protein